MNRTALLIDIGSTFTKATCVDLEAGELLGRAQAPSTVQQDVSIGLSTALDRLKDNGIDWSKADYKLACSSAAGGLRMIAIGLVPELTVEAAKMAALGAGAKLLGTYAYELTAAEIERIERDRPDIILLAGGTDGGNKDVILHNARMVAESELRVPIVLAGNKVAAPSAAEILTSRNKEVYLTENVMPSLEELNTQPVQETIREIFLDKIVQAKGLDKAEGLIDRVVMPTPEAVLRAAKSLADGGDEEPGWGELLVVDIGGATTDVHSIATGQPHQQGVVVKGLSEPRVKRTVEGGLGMRYSAVNLLQTVGYETFSACCRQIARDMDMSFDWSQEVIEDHIQSLSTEVDQLPHDPWSRVIDLALGQMAAQLAMLNHVGKIETVYTPFGPSYIQHGKDLTQIGVVIGTGGVLAYNDSPGEILEGILSLGEEPTVLAPRSPKLYVDHEYILAAMGLLSEVETDVAIRIMKKYLKSLST